MAFGQPNYYYQQQYGQQNYNPYMNNQYIPSYPNMMNNNQQLIQSTAPPSPSVGQPPTLYGKVVDGIDVVRAMDVPINQAAICPKADLSAVYIKSWNVDGTTKISEYKLSADESSSFEPNLNSILGDIKNSIENLDKKIDRIKNNSSGNNAQQRKDKIGGRENE